MDFDTKIDASAYGCSVAANCFDGIANFIGVSFEIRNVAVFIQEGCQVTNGSETLFFGIDDSVGQNLGSVPEYVVVNARLVANLATQQLVNRSVEVLAHDVPKRNIDCTQRTHDCRPTKVREAVHVLPVMFDTEWVFSN